ncbi:Gfo/Idh/MocA family oxidoreductase [Alsobacter sp. SYSU M60028]|uniref:Gfo/Idh/MocA family oxidoreductase n=1 Tax=Alsobacter ponti TaxID=2962936 RepID=A0ABT1LDZ6_9HYPH|nr:Gfo/Idh/MocA family oxidoreductase [Alsobacter ponti]MCP8938463.1 Gfo/Idh/MocA family oxidoreductase [Alsobacter ponti]
MDEIGIGVIGTGFMGKAHALAWTTVHAVYPELPRPVLVAVADNVASAARAAAAQYGFRDWREDWRSVVEDPAVHAVSITAPNLLHHDMAVAAARAGKHIHCEKPLAPDAATALRMVQAAEAVGVVTQVGFNYQKNPLIRLARDMIAAGELGDILSFRAQHAEGFMADPDTPWGWRLDPAGGPGALADLGSHAIAMGRYLLGPIESLSADLQTVIASRPVGPGARERRAVEVDDVARLTVRFARGCGGLIEANWVATGRTMQLGFEVSGTKGSIAFTQERLNELHLFRAGADPLTSGFTRIEAGPRHEPYGRFCVAPGHQLGFNELKTIEMAGFLSAIAGGERTGPDFREAWEVQKVIDAAVESSRERAWRPVG